jgi:hypothetical protein
LHYPAFRWATTYFLGDAVAYQVTSELTSEENRRAYDDVHERISAALHSLAERAGPEAPLCVIASDHVWDAQHPTPMRPTPADATPLERCETLAFLYTMGSPIALWTLRFADGGEPIAFPGLGLTARYPELHPAWVNLYDRDDVISYPLRGLSEKYREVVTEDRAMNIGPPLIRSTPVAHLWYWHDSSVTATIGAALADAWSSLGTAPG